ncbi:hypothetical protein [Streptosporangium sp. NPDC050280]
MEQKQIRRPQKKLIRVPRQKKKRAADSHHTIDTRTPSGVYLPY